MDNMKAYASTAYQQTNSAQAGMLTNARNLMEPAPTAADDALSAIQGVVEYAQNLLCRIQVIADHLGVGIPPSVQSDKPKQVRSGAIGNIHETVDRANEIISGCHNYMAQIERQV